jgi:hypothetical protein
MERSDFWWEIFKTELLKLESYARALVKVIIVQLVIVFIGIMVFNPGEENVGKKRNTDITIGDMKIARLRTTIVEADDDSQITLQSLGVKMSKKYLAILLPLVFSIAYSRTVYMISMFHMLKDILNFELRKEWGDKEIWASSLHRRFPCFLLALSHWRMFLPADENSNKLSRPELKGQSHGFSYWFAGLVQSPMVSFGFASALTAIGHFYLHKQLFDLNHMWVSIVATLASALIVYHALIQFFALHRTHRNFLNSNSIKGEL